MEPTNDAEIRATIARFMGNERDYPNYLKDLNSMHEVEAELERRGLAQEHAKELWQLSSRELDRNPEFYKSVFIIAHTTASERAQAAYAVIKAQQKAD